MRKNNQLHSLEIESKAAKFRQENGFGETDPIYLKSLLLKKNIITIFKPLSGQLAGMAVKASEDALFMLINNKHVLGKQHFTIAHELYHLCIQNSFISQKCLTGLFEKQSDIEEKNADMFAANLLMPKFGVIELIPESERINKNTVSEETLYKIQHYYSVSFSAVIYRLVQLKLVDNTYFDKFQGRIKSGARQYGYSMDLYEPGNANTTIGNYTSLASKLYKEQRISEGYYFELLNAIGVDLFSDDLQNGNE